MTTTTHNPRCIAGRFAFVLTCACALAPALFAAQPATSTPPTTPIAAAEQAQRSAISRLIEHRDDRATIRFYSPAGWADETLSTLEPAAPRSAHVALLRKGPCTVRLTITRDPDCTAAGWEDRQGILSITDQTTSNVERAFTRTRLRTIVARTPTGVVAAHLVIKYASPDTLAAGVDQPALNAARSEAERLMNEASIAVDSLAVFPPGKVPPAKVSDNPAINPQPRTDGWWQTRLRELNNRVNKAALAQGAPVIFIGDSITQGWEGAGKEIWAKGPATLNAINLGIGGDRAQHVLHRITVESFASLNKPRKGEPTKAVVLLIGTNNLNSDEPAEVASGIRACVKAMAQRLPSAKIIVLAILPRGEKNDQLNQKAQLTNQLLSDWARNIPADEGGPRVRFLDIGATFTEADGSISRTIMPDLLHLSEEGYRRWWQALEPELKAILNEPQQPKQDAPKP